MMRARLLLLLAFALPSVAQQRPIFDPGDFVDPRQHVGIVLSSRLAAGGAAGSVDDYRPLHQNTRFLLLVNSVYWSRFQFDYKHAEVRGEENGPRRVQRCHCPPPQYFPTPPGRDETPAAPLPASKDILQFGVYRAVRNASPSDPPVMLRYRLTWTHQPVDTIITSFANGATERRSGRERSLGVDLDTYLRFRGRGFFGSLTYARTKRSGTTDDRTQRELAYQSRFPAIPVGGRVLLYPAVTIGGVSGRGATGINVVNPSVEAFLHEPSTRANFHLVWSPLATRSGAGGWQRHNQIALFVDRALFVKLFAKPHG